jgi:hypothetical protein
LPASSKKPVTFPNSNFNSKIVDKKACRQRSLHNDTIALPYPKPKMLNEKAGDRLNLHNTIPDADLNEKANHQRNGLHTAVYSPIPRI